MLQSRQPMAPAPYIRIGPYQVIALPGAGGMDEAYQARYKRVSREVALKVLPGPPTPWHYKISADGKRFLTVTSRAQGTGETPVTVVVNWLAGMKK